MSKRNPFRTFERVGNIIGGILVGVIVVGSFVAAGIGVSVGYGWGWWGLLLIVAVPVALILIALVAGLLRSVVDWICGAWRRAKWRWDDRHRDDSEQSA